MLGSWVRIPDGSQRRSRLHSNVRPVFFLARLRLARLRLSLRSVAAPKEWGTPPGWWPWDISEVVGLGILVGGWPWDKRPWDISGWVALG